MSEKLKFFKVKKKPPLDEYDIIEYELTNEIIEIPKKIFDNAIVEEITTPNIGKIKKMVYGNRVWYFIEKAGES